MITMQVMLKCDGIPDGAGDRIACAASVLKDARQIASTMTVDIAVPHRSTVDSPAGWRIDATVGTVRCPACIARANEP